MKSNPSQHSDSDSHESFMFDAHEVSLHKLIENHLIPFIRQYSIELSPSSTPSSSNDAAMLLLSAAKVAIKSFNKKKRCDLTADQQTALHQLDTWNADNSGPNILDKNDDAVKELTFSYSRVFLLGKLSTPKSNKVDFKFDETLRIEPLRESHIAFGHLVHRDHTVLEIRVNPKDFSAVKGVTRQNALFGTLFHECVHAYFAQMCCDHSTNTFECSNNREPLWPESTSFHTVGWVYLAAGIEIALHKLMDLGTDLAVFRSLLNEYSVNSAPRLTADDWKGFFELYSWSGVDYLISKLSPEELFKFADSIKLSGDVMFVFMEEYKKEKEIRERRLADMKKAFTKALTEQIDEDAR